MSTERTTDDGRTFVIYPPSTMHRTSVGRWWHPEDCKVLSGECTCEPRLVGLGGDSDEA